MVSQERDAPNVRCLHLIELWFVLGLYTQVSGCVLRGSKLI